MERSVFDITLDLQRSFAPGEITVRQGDTHRTLRFHLADGGKPYALTDVRAVLTAQKPDGSHLFNHCVVDGDRICYDLTSQTTSCPGQVECQLRLYGADDALLTTAAFALTVEDTVYTDGDETVESTDEATALTKLMLDADEKLRQMDAALKNEANHAIIDDSGIGSDAWSSKKIMDRLCPGFEASGSVAVCEPVEGYPLEVVSRIDETEEWTPWNRIMLTRCGKNLFDFKKGVEEIHFTSSTGGDTLKYGYAIHLPAGTYTAHAVAIGGSNEQFVYCYLNDTDGNYLNLADYIQGQSNTETWLRQGETLRNRIFSFDRSVVLYIYKGSTTSLSLAQETLVDNHNIQIEVGSVATDYEPYSGETFTADLSAHCLCAGFYNWTIGLLTADEGAQDQLAPTAVVASDGTNYLYSNCGKTTVRGRVDPLPLLTKLMEGNNG